MSNAMSWRRIVLLGGMLVALAGIIMYGAPALAQEAEPELTPEQQEAIAQAEERSFEEEITVTGSLIPRPTLESMSPVSVMDPTEITYTGALRLEDVVRQLPQVFSGQNSTISNGASGTATVDLRNMGADRTLVLINGRRTAPGDAWSTSTDLNFIPAVLVKRVDVLTGGASSVYGADAVTGVVNFVLDEDFEGMRGTFAWNGYQHDNNNGLAARINEDAGFPYPTGSGVDGEQYNFNLALGHKFGEGRGHASIYVDYRNIDALKKDARDYTNCATAQNEDGPSCSGSGTIPTGRFQVFNRDWIKVGDYVLDEATGNTFRPRAGDVYNYAPDNFMQRPDEKWSAGAFMNYEFNQYFDVYAEVMFMDDYTDAQIAPSGNFNNTQQINCDNPMMSPQQRDIICTQNGFEPDEYANLVIGRRSVETGPRTSQMRHTTWRFLAGLRGDLSDAWSYDVYAMYAQMLSPQMYVGDLSVSRMTDALDVIGDPDDPSTWECRSGNDGCAPWNLFQIGGVTQEAADYIMLNMELISGTKTEMVNGVLNGDLGEYGIKFPTATEGIQVALGADYRNEMLYVHPDDNYEAGNGSGQGGPTVWVDGSYDVAEYYFEGLVPIVQDAPGFKDLSLELGYRFSDYSSVGGTDTWKAQATWAPVDLFKLRLGIASATRAPNVQELYRPQGLGLNGASDPCAGTDPAATLEQCLLTGMTAAQYGSSPENPAGQYNTWEGGNPNLDPETADTITAGIVITPPSVSGLSVAVDYWDIQIDDVIQSFDADSVLAGCIANGDPGLCSLIHRDVAGTLWLFTDGYTITTQQNLGTLEGEGVDLNYAWLIGIGDSGFLNTSLIGTWMLTDSLDNPLIGFDCVGYFGEQCDPYPTPEWRHTARISWETNFNMVFTLGWRYISSVLNDDTSDDPDLNSNSLGDDWLQINDVYEFDAYNYFDLAWTWDFADHYQVVLGINNILDEEPPFATEMQDNDYGTGFYGFYDAYGRQLHASIHFDF
ncbi:MAG TPA: TonB-dependent receptor [Thermoanaerobaculales bacterium]|nr:TonB-dependent receptor [Thermoanaerobaculales bacterium]HPA79753.1 TonB-dependent receptor [Thermoanaerobaculales bacterium]HQL29381.1 TonB-dependent receptor [Thermoanaerobaculales bacterium]HQN96063.1 TonB-dependent receptor [Thermoanaerobaculales bacterium]HQP42683.1 TonB-dependent receptor [Thermoanaerobaculales bacterium]